MRVCKCCCWLQLHNQRSWGNKGFRLELTFGAYFMVPSQYAEMLCKSVRKKKKKALQTSHAFKKPHPSED